MCFNLIYSLTITEQYLSTEKRERWREREEQQNVKREQQSGERGHGEQEQEHAQERALYIGAGEATL